MKRRSSSPTDTGFWRNSRSLMGSGNESYVFHDRFDAGRILAQALAEYANRSDTLVLGLPRGGVSVGFEVARALHAPLDIFVVRKLGAPGQEELAMGAIASGGARVLNQPLLDHLHIAPEQVEAVTLREEAELIRREKLWRHGRSPLAVEDVVCIVIDDGLATGASMRVAVQALRELDPAAIIVGVPVGAAETCEELRAEADEVVCAHTPDPFFAVGRWYEDFGQVSDDQVSDLLERSRHGYAE